MPELFRLTTLSEAMQRLEEALPEEILRGRLAVETVNPSDAAGRVVAEDVVSPVDLPPFSRSIMDGFAVRAQDTFGATDGLPGQLTVIGEVKMGRPATVSVGAGQAAKIPTGGMLPDGANAVVMIEHTQPFMVSEVEPCGEQTIEVVRSVAPGENVIRVGEDLSKSEVMLRAGRRLRPQEIGALAGVGILSVQVYRRPRLGLLSTGNEIIPPDSEPEPGQIRDINSAALTAAAQNIGAEVIFFGIVRDNREELRARLKETFESCDMVILSGGTSVGIEDMVAECIAELGPPGILAHGLALKPGKPVIIAVALNKPVFGLPGHPASSLLTFDLVVSPLLRKMAQCEEKPRAKVRALLARNLPSAPGREDFYRVRFESREDKLWAVPLLGKSALISTLLRADGLLHIPAEREGVYEGEEVEVELFREG
ncbi:MAG: molybdopterin molybdenumtransferase MoeA [Armatimonadetes bacterium]|nr:molybdopterin molybdenumtransferase MoeA [Armatimonadota bacterium]NIM23978.1 molybdopterin molybdenumtransferase MoeA [Armatimonadota bacterium]NIM67825.1 molybdopterin molybdenumtransferase MoeA [Armatimonadota bacterium]NIN06059.1 molybdopterin molybdenumtransferase MoeA [Armatimonadota bacterium]NIO97451.1 molybdopterin molybdenumtransferase MoeA [Armatimonadota bacterium]